MRNLQPATDVAEEDIADVQESELAERDLEEETTRYIINEGELYEYDSAEDESGAVFETGAIVRAMSSYYFEVPNERCTVMQEMEGDSSHDTIQQRVYAGSLSLLPDQEGWEIRIQQKKKEEELRLAKEKKEKIDSLEKSILPQVRESLEAIYPGNWDIQMTDTYCNVIIKYPKVDITNGKPGVKYTITDLYVKLSFDFDFILVFRPSGLRGSLSYLDYESNYRHSHLPRGSRSTFDYQTFCLGGSELATMITEWQMPGREFNILEFELLLYQLSTYVAWESLGGGPYYRISSIKVDGTKVNVYSDEKRKYFKHFVQKQMVYPLKYNKSKNRFTIEFEEMEKFLTEKNDELQFPVCKKIDKDDYFYNNDQNLDNIRQNIERINSKLEIAGDTMENFRGEPIVVKVNSMDISKRQQNNLETVVHPDLTRYFIENLQNFTNYYFIKNYGK
jgi:hypothetical protein